MIEKIFYKCAPEPLIKDNEDPDSIFLRHLKNLASIPNQKFAHMGAIGHPHPFVNISRRPKVCSKDTGQLALIVIKVAVP